MFFFVFLTVRSVKHTCASTLRHPLQLMWNIAVALLSCLMSHFKERRKTFLYRPWCSCHQNSLCKPVTKNRRQWFVYCLQIKLRKPSQNYKTGHFLPHLQKWLVLLLPQREHVCTSQLQTTNTPVFSTLTTNSMVWHFSMSKLLKKWLSFVTVMKKYYIWTFNLAFGIVHVTAAKHFCVKSRNRWWGNERDNAVYENDVILERHGPMTFLPGSFVVAISFEKKCRKRGLSGKHDLTSESWIQNCAGPQYKN